jgi:hypothetical protein
VAEQIQGGGAAENRMGLLQPAGHCQVSLGDSQQSQGFRRGHGGEYLP